MIIALYIVAAVIMAVGSLSLAWQNRALSQISGRRILRVIGHFVLSLSRQCFSASVGDKFMSKHLRSAVGFTLRSGHWSVWLNVRHSNSDINLCRTPH
jgi:hypothetical protein